MAESSHQSDPQMAVAKLKQQNQKLSNELNELTRILEEAVQKQRKAEIESKRPKFSEQEDKELAQLHSQINHMKKEKTALQRQLSANADSNTTDLENELVYLKRKVKEAEAERNTLKKMQQQHAKTLASIIKYGRNSDWQPKTVASMHTEPARQAAQARLRAYNQLWDGLEAELAGHDLDFTAEVVASV